MKFKFENQKELLTECEREGVALADRLRGQQANYDSLVYADGATPRILSRLPDFTPVDERPKVAKGIPCVSFFSGAGGLDIGFECAGFKTVADVEIVPMFCETLRKNGHKAIVGPPNAKGDMSDPKTVIRDLEAFIKRKEK